MGKHQSKDRQVTEFESSKSKNVNVASVAVSTAIQTNETCPDLLTTTAAGVESIPDPELGKYFPFHLNINTCSKQYSLVIVILMSLK